MKHKTMTPPTQKTFILNHKQNKLTMALIVTEILQKLAENNMRGIVIIAGPSGSGKTSVAKNIEEVLDRLKVQVARIQMDDYYKSPPPDAGLDYNYDVPAALNLSLLKEHLQALLRGETIEKPVYGFGQFRTYTEPFAPTPILVVDGLFVLGHEGIRDLALIKIFVTADEEVCLERRIARDTKGRDRQTKEQVRSQWFGQVAPGREQYVDPSAVHADIVIVNDGHAGLPCHEAIAELVKNPPANG